MVINGNIYVLPRNKQIKFHFILCVSEYITRQLQCTDNKSWKTIVCNKQLLTVVTSNGGAVKCCLILVLNQCHNHLQ